MLLLVFRSLLADAGKIEGSFVARHSIFVFFPSKNTFFAH